MVTDGGVVGTVGVVGALAQETDTRRHTTSSNPVSIINFFITEPPAYYALL